MSSDDASANAENIHPSPPVIATNVSDQGAITDKAKKEQEKALKKLARKAENLAKIVEANGALLKERSASQTTQTTQPERKPAVSVEDDCLPAVNVEDYVKVEADSSPGMNRPEGFGFVEEARGVGAATIVTVKYTKAYDNGSTHRNIPFTDITPAVYGLEFVTERPARKRRKVEAFVAPSPAATKPKEKDKRLPIERLIDCLRDGYRKSRKRGWHRDDLNLGKGVRLNHTEKNQLLLEVTMLQQYLSEHPNAHIDRYARSQKFKKRLGRFNPVSVKYLVEQAWGRSNSYLHELRRNLNKTAIATGSVAASELLLVAPAVEIVDKESKDTTEVKSVIDDYDLAEKKYTACYLFAVNECRQAAKDNLDSVSRVEYLERFNTAKKKYETLDDGKKAMWEAKRREHLLRQPAIKNQIIESIKRNPRRSWKCIEADINHWCSDTTIYRWVTSKAGYALYAERIIPLLNDAQRKKHFEFAKLFRKNWGLGRGKYLLIHYDEKWFWGLVMRRQAKSCEELGIDPHSYSAYHKSHIAKTMGVAFTAFAFEDNMENGGDAIKLGFFRAQSYKVAEKLVRESVRQADGSIKQSGPVKRKKGDLYLVDCAVTGTAPGTADAPKFPLRGVFEDYIFPLVSRMVGKGGDYEGYTPVFQGDNAGPHAEAAYLKYVKEYCESMGWHWEPQAPQMPHMNVLDLSVFPAMSRRHIALARSMGGLRVLNEDEIWAAAEKVWRDLPSCKIASGYVQAYRIAEKIIKVKGDNGFLGSNGTPHVGIRKDFHETEKGLSRKDGKVFGAPN